MQLAVVHAQFEILHPFLDGNGRIGRLIVPILLFEKEILARPMFYLSSYLEAHRAEYIRNLRSLGTTSDSWNEWVAFFSDALIHQAYDNAAKSKQILSLYATLKQKVLGLTHSQFGVPLLDRLFEKPVFQSSALDGKPHMPSKPIIMNLLAKLKEARILKVVREGSGRRPQVLALAELVNLCEGYDVI